MSRRNRESIENLSGLQELDRLVVQVMRALQSGRLQDDHRSQEGNVIYRERWGEGADEADGMLDDTALDAPNADKRAEEHSQIATEDWEDGEDVPVTDDWTGPSPDEIQGIDSDADAPMGPEASAGTVLSSAEIAFIDRTCRWLERRPQRDIILDQIWRQLLPAEAAESGNESQEESEPQEESELQKEIEPQDDESGGDPDEVD